MITVGVITGRRDHLGPDPTPAESPLEAPDLPSDGVRPTAWLEQHLADDATGSLRAILLDHPPKVCYRSLVLIKRADREVEHFLLGVLPEDFDRLEDVVGEALLTFMRWALMQIPLSPLPVE